MRLNSARRVARSRSIPAIACFFSMTGHGRLECRAGRRAAKDHPVRSSLIVASA